MGGSGNFMTSDTKVIFFGTPDYSVPVMDALYKNYKLVAVVTQAAKLVGRKQIRTFSPVDNWAHKRKIPVFTSFEDQLPEASFAVVASFGKIIPEKIIKHFPNGILNIHPSLLPKYRGASPIQYQIIDGIKETGVTIIKMDAKMDHGPIISQITDEIKDNDTNETLRKRLFEKSVEILMELLPNYLAGKINPKEQNHDDATFTKMISREEGYVDLQKDDINLIDRKFRALSPWPGIFTSVKIDDRNLRLKILKMHLDEGKLVLDKVQLEGKKAVLYKQFIQAYPEANLP